mmetsp:Transcript_30244/g.73566  ORF Transcript_30244/g.73566 Transcript_30244/m.73566 type:complete len:220 (+) Transcript_30244:2883-3542(+)
MTRSRNLSSIWSNFFDSFPDNFETGIPVALDTIVAIASASTASCNNRFFFVLSRSTCSSCSSSLSSSSCNFGIVACSNSPALPKSPLARATSISRLACANSSFKSLTRVNDRRSSCHVSVSFLTRSSSSSTSCSTTSRRLIDSRSSSPFRALNSICFVIRSRSTFHSTSGFDSCSNRNREHASSTRSIDLSGWNRSVMYRSLNSAAATNASSLIRIPAW